jgi:hypothetical protein
MTEPIVITIDNEQDDDWIRSPQVSKGHPSDWELFGHKKIAVKEVEPYDLLKTEWDEAKHPRDHTGEFAPKGSITPPSTGDIKPIAPERVQAARAHATPAWQQTYDEKDPDIHAYHQTYYRKAMHRISLWAIDNGLINNKEYEEGRVKAYGLKDQGSNKDIFEKFRFAIEQGIAKAGLGNDKVDDFHGLISEIRTTDAGNLKAMGKEPHKKEPHPVGAQAAEFRGQLTQEHFEFLPMYEKARAVDAKLNELYKGAYERNGNINNTQRLNFDELKAFRDLAVEKHNVIFRTATEPDSIAYRQAMEKVFTLPESQQNFTWDIHVNKGRKKAYTSIHQAMDWYHRCVVRPEDLTRDNPVVEVANGTQHRVRAGYMNSLNRVGLASNSNTQDVIHELAHSLEHHSDLVHNTVMNFYNKRTAGEPIIPLRRYALGYHYSPGERAKPDNFFEPYCGRIYDDGSTEALSCGMAQMFSDPVGFAHDDPEYFDMVYNVMRGHYDT